MRARSLLLALVLAATVSAQSTPHKIFFPEHVSGLLTTNGAANALYCVTMPAPFSLGSLTKLAVYTGGSSAGTIVGAAIYPNSDGGSAIASMSQTITTPGVIKQSGISAFSVTGGTLYRVCTCASTGNLTNLFLGVQQATFCCQDQNLTQLIQAFHPTYVGTAANACTLGVPPSTTGAITADATSPGRNAERVPIVLAEQ